MSLIAKEILKTPTFRKKILDAVYDYSNSIQDHTVIPYNHCIENIKATYENKAMLLYKSEEPVVEYYLEFSKLSFDKPILEYANGQYTFLTPQLAVLKKLSYTANIHADLKIILVSDNVRTVKEHIKNKKIGAIPVMRGSVLDPHPIAPLLRGHFITKGIEKVVLAIEEIKENVLLRNVENQTVQIYVYSMRQGYRYTNKIIYKPYKPITFKFQPLNIVICPFALAKVFGYTDADMLNIIGASLNAEGQLSLCALLELSNKDRSETAAITQLANALSISIDEITKDKIKHMVLNYVLLHVGTDSQSIDRKLNYIFTMINMAISANLEKLGSTAIDDLQYKQVKTPGVLLEELFNYTLNKQVDSFKVTLLKHLNNKSTNLLNLWRAELLTNGLLNPIISGTWLGNRQNIAHAIDIYNTYGYMSTIRKIISPLLKKQQHLEARAIGIGYRGRIDPVDSGHGTIIGLVKALALGANVTYDVPFCSLNKFKKGTIPVYINGVYAFGALSVDAFQNTLATAKASGNLHPYVSVSYTKENIHVRTNAGRIVRLLYTKAAASVSTQTLAGMSKQELISKGYIVWLDCIEETTCKVAPSLNLITPEDTHAEIDPILLFSITSASIPFIQHTGSARIGYGQKLFKQAVPGLIKSGVIGVPFAATLANKALYTYCAQKPLVNSVIAPQLQRALDNVYPGTNITVLIAPVKGWNLEDATIINKAAIQRGLFKTYVYKTTTVETDETLTINNANGFILPEDIERAKPIENYAQIDEDGLVSPSSVLKVGQAMVTTYNLPRYVEKTSVINKVKYTDTTIFNTTDNAYVTNIIITKSKALTDMVYVTTCTSRTTEVGDKYTSRFAQKGIVGAVANPWQLPYEQSTGLVPDLVVAGSAYPTRHTLGHILEMVTGRACGAEGAYAENFFSDVTCIEEAFDILEAKGLGRYSEEEFIDPETGLLYKGKLFTGISYYLKLHHLAKEKLHVRATGPVQLLTRQATEGKAQNGGLRIGEMERDCILTYGAANLILERLNIDLMDYLLCASCNELIDVIYNRPQVCNICNGKNIYRIRLPHAFKLLLDLLAALHIKISLYIKKYDSNTILTNE